ncbi:hypothetical protein [Nostoc sp. 'Lobaria pulmonaria (5183) cyanobiont']|uniref:hypothetical protein n=1 Tax=Nostoc sp. 'Lobaria pulmonaria (5183) cyanobiont' TaxID=1618022 RepID=UPI001319E25E|nr:hypothetical protein [Nostoc sp. 'Lobaria pulmonaria (5183) cyanobiont']
MIGTHLSVGILLPGVFRQQLAENIVLHTIPSRRDTTRSQSFSTERSAKANGELQDFITLRPDARKVGKA